MFNIIKADVYRLLKNKSFWITLAVFSLLMVFIMFLQDAANNQLHSGIGETKDAGFYITLDTVVKSLNSFVTLFCYQFGALFLGIYMASFVCNEYSSGYIKNIAILKSGRKGIVFSKFAVATVVSLSILIISYLLIFLIGTIVIEDFKIEPLHEIIKSAGVMLLLYLATFSMITFISMLFKSKIAGIVVAFLVISGMAMPFINGIFDILHLSFLSEYTLSQFSLMFTSFNDDMLVKMIVVCIIYILLYNVLSLIVIQKRDL